VLLDTIREGIRGRDYFGYASSVGADGRYQGLQFGSAGGSIYLDEHSVLVKPDIAAQQLEAEAAARAAVGGIAYPTTAGETKEAVSVRNGGAATTVVTPPDVAAAARPTRFYGSVRLDSTRMMRDADRIAQEVIQHLTSLAGASVEVMLEISATMPEGVPDHVVRTVTENCRTLKFTIQGFENV